MYTVWSSCGYEVVYTFKKLEDAKAAIEDEVGPVELIPGSDGTWMATQQGEEVCEITRS